METTTDPTVDPRSLLSIRIPTKGVVGYLSALMVINDPGLTPGQWEAYLRHKDEAWFIVSDYAWKFWQVIWMAPPPALDEAVMKQRVGELRMPNPTPRHKTTARAWLSEYLLEAGIDPGPFLPALEKVEYE